MRSLYSVGGLTDLGGPLHSEDLTRDLVTTGLKDFRLRVKNL